MIAEGDTIDLQDGRRVIVLSACRMDNLVRHVVLSPRGGSMADAFQIPHDRALESIELKLWRHYPAGSDMPPVPVKFGPPLWCRTPMTCECKRDLQGAFQSCPCL